MAMQASVNASSSVAASSTIVASSATATMGVAAVSNTVGFIGGATSTAATTGAAGAGAAGAAAAAATTATTFSTVAAITATAAVVVVGTTATVATTTGIMVSNNNNNNVNQTLIPLNNTNNTIISNYTQTILDVFNTSRNPTLTEESIFHNYLNNTINETEWYPPTPITTTDVISQPTLNPIMSPSSLPPQQQQAIPTPSPIIITSSPIANRPPISVTTSMPVAIKTTTNKPTFQKMNNKIPWTMKPSSSGGGGNGIMNKPSSVVMTPTQLPQQQQPNANALSPMASASPVSSAQSLRPPNKPIKPPPKFVSNIFLIDTKTKKHIAEVISGTVFDQSVVGTDLSIIIVIGNRDIKPIEFIYDGMTNVEEKSPFSMAGDDVSSVYSVSYLAYPGEKYIVINAYQEKELLGTMELLFTISNGGDNKNDNKSNDKNNDKVPWKERQGTKPISINTNTNGAILETATTITTTDATATNNGNDMMMLINTIDSNPQMHNIGTTKVQPNQQQQGHRRTMNLRTGVVTSTKHMFSL